MHPFFFVVDHCSLELLGIHATCRGTRFEALEPIRQAVRRSFGAFGQEVASGVVLRHNNGSQFVSRVFQDEVKFLGIASSPSFIRQPQGNGIARTFCSYPQGKFALAAFVRHGGRSAPGASDFSTEL